MYRIAVCDDNPEILTQVCTTLSGSPLGKELELTPFHSGAALAAALRSGARFALLILDIELDTVDGVAIGRLLRGRAAGFCDTAFVYLRPAAVRYGSV